MTRAVFMSLADELRPFLEPGDDCPRAGDVLSVEKQLAMTLYYLKDQGSLRMTANTFGVAVCTLSVVLRKVCTWKRGKVYKSNYFILFNFLIYV